MTEQEIATAILARLNEALSPRHVAYDIDEVPSPRPSEYVEVTLSRVFGGERRLCATIATGGYRLTVRGVSEAAVRNVRNRLETCRNALEFQRLDLGLVKSTPIQFETEDPAGEDEGWFSGLLVFTFTI